MPTTIIDDTFYTGTRGGSGSAGQSYEIHFLVELASQSIENNTSYLNITKTYKGIRGNAWNGTSGTDIISGLVNNSVTISQVYPTNTVVTVQSLTNVPVTHNADGTLTGTIGTSWEYGSVYNSYMAASYSKTYDIAGLVPDIPRASNISLSASSININSTSGSVSYTITPYSSSFTHSLTWGFGSNTATISNATSGTLTYSQLLGKLTTATNGTLTLTLTTYNNGTAIGSKTATASVTVDASVIKPTLSLGNIAVNSSPISSYLVAGYSSAKITSTAGNSTGSSAVTTSFTASHGTLSPATTTSTSATTITGSTLPDSASNYTLTITASAKDSRGVTVTANKTKTVYGYSKPIVTLTAYRTATNASSDTTRDDSGAYVYVTFSGAVGASVNNQNSIQSTTCTYAGSISGTATNGAHYALGESQKVTFTCTVTDKVTSSVLSVTVGTIAIALDLYDDGAGNVGVGMGTPFSGASGWFNCSLNQRLGDGTKEGWLRMYSDSGGYSNIRLTTGQTSSRTIRFPNKSGTLAVREDFKYSTSEVNTGTVWVDDKVIYKKTLSYNNTAIANGTTWNHGISNINEVVKVEAHLNADGTYIGFPSTTNNSANDLGLRVSKTQIIFFGNDSWSANTNRTIYVTVYYTKT